MGEGLDVVDELREVEQLKALKARYCRTLDAKDWDGFRELFTDDFLSDTTASGGPVVVGADEFLAFLTGTLATACTVHQVHAPEIAVTSATTATGIWAMQDLVRLLPGVTMQGFGHYHETYAKTGGRWLIKTSTLTRNRMDVRTPLGSVWVSPRLKRLLDRGARRRTAAT